MCVLTYLPQKGKNFIITNNRDEHIGRKKAFTPKPYLINNKSIFYPEDAEKSGTWIGYSEKHTICLLNGAFEKHVSNPPYLASRGKIILDFFVDENIESLNNVSFFKGLENCTIIVIENKLRKVSQFVWDGKSVHFNDINSEEPQIWSSCTLYTSQVILQRKLLFQEFIKAGNLNNTDLLNFHRFGDLGDENVNLTMSRSDGIKTQCITQIIADYKKPLMYFWDLIDNTQVELLLN